MSRCYGKTVRIRLRDQNDIFRSAAMAQIANMPVATRRMWAQRNRAVQPATAASGHRLHSPADMHVCCDGG